MHPIDLKFLDRMIGEISKIEVLSVEQLACGSAKDFADYQYRVGYLRALADVRQIAKVIRDEDDDRPNDRTSNLKVN